MSITAANIRSISVFFFLLPTNDLASTLNV